MKGSLKFGLFIFTIVFVAIGIIDLTSKKPIIWDRTFDQKDKNPFGLYVTHEELPHMLDKKVKITDIKEDLFTYFESNNRIKAPQEQLLFISEAFDFGDAVNNRILKFATNGGKVFIAAERINQKLLDTLQVDYEYFYGTDDDIEEEIKVELTQDGIPISFDKSNLDYSFTKLPKSATILGGLRYKEHLLPNFISLKIGKGTIMLHITPELFGNYYLLNNQKQYQYVARAFSYLDGQNVGWYDFKSKYNESSTPLRVLLNHKGLRQAWYLLLVSLLLFLIFKSKREQRAVKTILPEPNLSKQFCETIATLYYENGSPENMVHKKIDYFLHDIRKKFHVDTLLIHEEEFLENLSQRSGVSKVITAEMIQLITQCQKRNHFTEQDLRNVNTKIEEFKVKAEM